MAIQIILLFLFLDSCFYGQCLDDPYEIMREISKPLVDVTDGKQFVVACVKLAENNFNTDLYDNIKKGIVQIDSNICITEITTNDIKLKKGAETMTEPILVVINKLPEIIKVLLQSRKDESEDKDTESEGSSLGEEIPSQEKNPQPPTKEPDIEEVKKPSTLNTYKETNQIKPGQVDVYFFTYYSPSCEVKGGSCSGKISDLMDSNKIRKFYLSWSFPYPPSNKNAKPSSPDEHYFNTMEKLFETKDGIVDEYDTERIVFVLEEPKTKVQVNSMVWDKTEIKEKTRPWFQKSLAKCLNRNLVFHFDKDPTNERAVKFYKFINKVTATCVRVKLKKEKPVMEPVDLIVPKKEKPSKEKPKKKQPKKKQPKKKLLLFPTITKKNKKKYLNVNCWKHVWKNVWDDVFESRGSHELFYLYVWNDVIKPCLKKEESNGGILGPPLNPKYKYHGGMQKVANPIFSVELRDFDILKINHKQF